MRWPLALILVFALTAGCSSDDPEASPANEADGPEAQAVDVYEGYWGAIEEALRSDNPFSVDLREHASGPALRAGRDFLLNTKAAGKGRDLEITTAADVNGPTSDGASITDCLRLKAEGLDATYVVEARVERTGDGWRVTSIDTRESPCT